ncbi:putative quinol monooxygenase [Kallotenue papyrolyticum]|uniref:putative quinol monooxygenase n=1 Tax=Kallotenue papyrolyticum TaxID=1325125 RepID=UPI0004785BA2|nr:antibiotic biosynthesis monooxygenase family protein [Kallotenue papyrolyticum]
MLARLVRLYLHPAQVEAFLALYAEARPRIEAQPGCLGVQLVRQQDDAAAFATWSLWTDAEALERYRHSPFFGELWPRVRRLLRRPAEAVSFEVVASSFAPQRATPPA